MCDEHRLEALTEQRKLAHSERTQRDESKQQQKKHREMKTRDKNVLHHDITIRIAYRANHLDVNSDFDVTR